MESAEASALRARSLLRLGDPAAAFDSLNAGVVPNVENGELALLRAVAAARIGSEAIANDGYVVARVAAISTGDTSLEAEIEFYLALAAVGDHDYVRARELCRFSLDIAATPPVLGTSASAIPIAHVASRTQELLAIISAARGSYDDARVYTRAALATLDSCAIKDRFQEGFALKNLAIIARDFDEEGDWRLVADRASVFPWTEDIAGVHFSTLEALGWCHALRGDVFSALRQFRFAANRASTDPERILALVSRVIVARELGQSSLVLEEIDYALGLADAYDWNDAPGDSRFTLLALAQAAAPIMPARARATLDRYVNIRKSMDHRFAARVEPRVRAEEAYTHGLVLRSEDRLFESQERLRVAFTLWREVGYEWRAARAAVELAELQAGDAFRSAVARELKRRPDSVFAPRARKLAA
jgi:tetratricopeptide (TPR) repeat protein